MTKRFPIDWKQIACESGCTKGTLAYSEAFDSWAVFCGNGGPHICMVTAPYRKGQMLEGKRIRCVRIREGQWEVKT